MRDVSMQTCAPGNPHHQIQHEIMRGKWLQNSCMIVSDIHHRTVQGKQYVVGNNGVFPCSTRLFCGMAAK